MKEIKVKKAVHKGILTLSASEAWSQWQQEPLAWRPRQLHWMTVLSLALQHALTTPQCPAASLSQPLNLRIGFFRMIRRSRLRMLGEQRPSHRGSMTRRLPSLGQIDIPQKASRELLGLQYQLTSVVIAQSRGYW